SRRRAQKAYFAEVGFADLGGATEKLARAFQAFKLDQTGEGEVELVRIEGVKDDHFAPGEAKMTDTIEDGLLIVQKITDENDNTATFDLAGDFVEHGSDIGGLFWFKCGQRVHDRVNGGEVPRAR